METMVQTPQSWSFQVIVCCPGYLDNWMSDYVGGLRIDYQKDGSTLVTGDLPDMAAVYGFVLRLRDAGIAFTSLTIRAADERPRLGGE